MLAWLQLHDSAFPAGRFVHSGGVEAWLSAHPTAEPKEICALADAFVRRSVATLDAVLTAHSWAASTCAELAGLDQLTTSYKTSTAARTASQACGRQLALAASLIGACDSALGQEYLAAVSRGEADGNLAVVEGIVQRALGVGQYESVLGSIRSAYSSVLSAAVRVGRLGPMQAQRALLEQRKTLAALADQAVLGQLDDLGSTALELELHAMRHETATARMFAT